MDPRLSLRCIRVLLTVTTGCLLAGCAANNSANRRDVATPQPVNSLPLYDVRAEIGDADLQPGDAVKIDQVLCTSPTLKPGEVCIIRGKYTLASRDAADLSFYVTSSQYAGPTPVDRRQIVSVKRGSGTFALRHVLTEGYPHLSFYAGGGSIGGVYFGEGNSVLKEITWKKGVAGLQGK